MSKHVSCNIRISDFSAKKSCPKNQWTTTVNTQYPGEWTGTTSVSGPELISVDYLSDELELTHEFLEVFLAGEEVHAPPHVLDKAGPADHRVGRGHLAPHRQRADCRVQEPVRLGQVLAEQRRMIFI